MHQDEQKEGLGQPSEGESSTGEEHSMRTQVEMANKIEALSAELEEVKRENGQFKELAQRVQADFLNYKKRTDDERQELQKYAASYVIVQLLPVIDEFELAIDHANNSKAEAQWLEGIKLIQRKLFSLLESEGVRKIEALGKEFDPFEHEALGHEQRTDAKPGQVLSVVRKGYRLHDRVVRPAQVIVAKGSETANIDSDVSEDKEE